MYSSVDKSTTQTFWQPSHSEIHDHNLVQKPLDGTDNAWDQVRRDTTKVPYFMNYGKQVNGLTTEINLAFRQVVTQTNLQRYDNSKP
jgi:hypothetical protein